MSKRKYVDKKTILKAIANEPLAPGNWVKLDDNGKAIKDKNCQVCAVGAVLRNAGMGNNSIVNYGDNMVYDYGSLAARKSDFDEKQDMEDRVALHLRDEHYLAALSIRYEWQADLTGNGKRTRDILAKFVKANFPEKIKL